MPDISHLLGAAGNMAIQRAASGPLAGNPAASAILGGANMSAGGCSCGGGGGTCEECKKKVQRKAASDVPSVPSAFEGALARSGGGSPLGPHTRNTMESRFGESFNDVRVHDDTSAAEAAHYISAHAFTTGRDIYFGAGRYDPHSTGGQKLIAHELTHVLQQRRGAVAPGMKSLNASSHDDVFEREAELVESAFEKPDYSLHPSWTGSRGSPHRFSPAGEPSTLQRKCGCGGTCSKCSEAATGVVPQESRKTPLQRKARNIEDRSSTQTQDAEPGDRISSAKSMQRKCSCGGTCSKCSGQSTGMQAEPVKRPPLQRKDNNKDKDTQPQVGNTRPDSQNDSVLSGHAVQRKCSCGAASGRSEDESKAPIQPKCSCGASASRPEEESKALPIQRKADPLLDSIQDKAGHAAGKNETAARKNPAPGPAPKPAPRPGSQPPGKVASPVGSPKRGPRHATPGSKAAAPLQRAAVGAASAGVSRDHYEREAEAASTEVARGGFVSSEKLSKLDHESIQPLSWEWCNPFSDPDCGIGSTAGVVAGEAEEIAQEVRDAASKLADAIGGVLEYIDNLMVITIPPMHVCDPHTVQWTLPEFGVDIPFLAGVVPVAPGLEIYGELGAHLGFIPEVSFHIGPCETHEIKIEIHPISLAAKAQGGLDLTLGLGVGAELRAGMFGEIGAILAWPDPPLVAKIPAAHLEAGLAGFIRIAAADHFSLDISAAASLSGFSFNMNFANNFGLATDLGLAGYGSLSALGVDLCTLYWPLFKDHRDFVLSLGLGLGLSVGTEGMPDLDVDPDAPTFDKLDWDDLGFKIQRDMFKDNCPLCDFLYDLGLMPSQRGGAWKGHPKPAWSDGPLHVYPRDPGIKSEALCRGACGADCDTCEHENPHRECEETRDGHFWWVYPHYEDCGTHLGCRNHDACYDWCVNEYNEKGKLGVILGPCHRLCDFECICNYNLPQCVGWIGGGKPHDGRMAFSDAPRKEPGCKGPCPHRVGRKGGGESWLVCMPTLELFPRQNVAADPLHETTGKHTIWRKDAWIPYVGLATIEIYASGTIDGALSAGLGPGTMNNICFDFDPKTGKYKAGGQLVIPADFLASLKASAELGADARWFLIVKVASAKGTLEATAKLAGNAKLILSGNVDISCDHGKPTLESDLDIPGCLDLSFDLKAGFDIKAIGFTVFSRKWELFSAKWNKCWGEDVTIKHTGKDAKIDLRDKTISLTDLLEWLLSDTAEKTEPSSQQRQVKESPLTLDTAKTIPDLAPQLDQTIPVTGTVTVGPGASNTVGTEMMTRFLTQDHPPGSGPGGAQNNIYGFRKLPTRGAGAGNGFSAKEYIKGHLLNEKLGGPGEDQNLFPITAAANQDHSREVETDVKRLVNNRRLVVMYGVRVSGQEELQDVDVLGDGTCTYKSLNADFDCTFGTYTLFTDNTVELDPTTDKTIRSTFDRAGFISGVKAKNCPQK
jgi:bacterioferritin-associated ferredoxin